jgi:hypothetical protein
MLVVVLLLPLSLAMDNGAAAKMVVENGSGRGSGGGGGGVDGIQWRRQCSMEAMKKPAGVVRGRHNERMRGWRKER